MPFFFSVYIQGPIPELPYLFLRIFFTSFNYVYGYGYVHVSVGTHGGQRCRITHGAGYRQLCEWC